ncbi:arsenite efflux MFS transporter ArsK [Mesorhizobium sp. NBSH29]|uniref:arsenite efflux MFS transporter ArsK n=1 Tax=Mesorhizobium sp. NBSH29 TaxID=2654249 RepID=UPI0018964FDB|nr:arsenite efflux MFS transporter ArsK [Mesorhizobium sp. NBSH29]QPC88421.1 arsenite efflux MFS transporter ArsK [Mesorhizobium sp. NBSH29]
MRISDQNLSYVVWGLGATQIIGYGTLYYSFSILAPEMATDFGWALEWIYGALSIGLLAGGFAAPLSGRLMDRFGAGQVMAVGSVAAALSMFATALAPNAAIFVAFLLVMEVASGLVQYNGAFALLVQVAPNRAQRSITHLTLIAGFASTLAWPLTSWMHTDLSWRTVYIVFAAANLLICLPVHWKLSRLTRQRMTAKAPQLDPVAIEEVDTPLPPEEPLEIVEGSLPQADRRRGFIFMAAGFTLMSFVLSALLVHMVPMLTAVGLGTAAVLVGTMFGPAQVFARFINMTFGKNLSPSRLAILSACALPMALAILLATAPWLAGAFLFAVLFGAGSGLNSIVQGTLPLTLFGSEGYGALVGRVSAIRLVVSAAAPFIFAYVTEQFGVTTALGAAIIIGVASVLAFAAVARLADK